jgi:small subunit ribosomal protein S14e
MPPKKAARPAQENISLGPQVRDGKYFPILPNSPKFTQIPTRLHPKFFTSRQVLVLHKANKTTGELVFGVARIFASFNDTFVHVTDLRSVHP